MPLIAQGSYGCVYKPSLKCSKKKVDYNNKVSKLISKYDNEDEEYIKISEIDKNAHYYLGKPEVCNVKAEDFYTEVLASNCNLINDSENSKDFKLLITKYGGLDLKRLNYKEYLMSGNTPQLQFDLFWLNVYHLFKGIQLFVRNDLSHHDLKPDNILFNPKTYRFNFIDFGLMKSIYPEIKRNYGKHSVFHWSYPPESVFIDQIKKKNLDNLKNTLKSAFIDNKTTRRITKSDSGSFIHLLKYYTRNITNKLTENDIDDVIHDIVDGLEEYKDNYNEMIIKVYTSFDTYALGFTLNYCVNKMYETGYISNEVYLMMHNFFKKMYDFNIHRRIVDITILLKEYKSLLTKLGVLQRLEVTIERGEIISLEKSIKKVCPSGKELNILTNRCRNKCPENKIRNVKGNCVKNI